MSKLKAGISVVDESQEETTVEVIASVSEPAPALKAKLRNRSKTPLYILLPNGESIHLMPFPAEDLEVDATVLELPQVKVFVENRDIIIIKVN